MKKISVLLFIAIALSAPVFGQAYSDIKKIDALLNKPSDSLGRQLLQIVLPYYNSTPTIDKDSLKKYFNNEVGDLIAAYLVKRETQFSAIKEEAKRIKDKELIGYYTDIDAALKKLKSTIGDTSSGIIPGLADSANIDITNINDEYKIYDFEIKLRVIKAHSDSLKNSLNQNDTARLNILIKFAGSIKDTVHVNKLLNNIDRIRTEISKIIHLKQDILVRIKSSDVQEAIDKSLKKKSLTKETFDEKLTALKYIPTQNLPNQPNATQVASLSAFKLPTQAEMIESLVIFISKRVGQEVAMSFIEVLKKRAKSVELVSEMFPQTMRLLQEGNTYEVPKLGSVWHYAIAQDLSNLPSNLANSKFLDAKLKNNPNKALFKDVITIGNLAKDGNSLPEISLLVGNNDLYPLKDSTMIMGFNLINMINQELSTSGGYSKSKGFWVNWSELSSFSNRDWDLFLRFIVLKYNTKEFNLKRYNIPLNDFTSYKWKVFKITLQKSLILLNQFQDRRLATLQSSNASLSNQIKSLSFWECQQALFDIVLNKELFSDTCKTMKSLRLVNQAIQIYKLQEQGNYAAMFRESINLINELMPKQSAKLNELFLKSWRAGKDKHQATVKALNDTLGSLNILYEELRVNDKKTSADTVELLRSFAVSNGVPNVPKDEKDAKILVKLISDKYTKSVRNVTGYKSVLAVRSAEGIKRILIAAITSNGDFAIDSIRPKSNLAVVLKTAEFFTDVMSAGNSEQLAQVIEAYAMPPGSYKVKRHSRYSVDLDAYVGLYGGLEGLSHSEGQNLGDFAPVWGLSAPIGLSFTWGGRHDTRAKEAASFLTRRGNPRTLNGNSFTLGLSVIDIAAPLAFRLSGDSQEALPETLTWSQIFSPGVHARWGIRNTPLCISTGLQYTPQLRKIEQTSKSQEAFRAYVGLFFDLPLFNIYRR